MSGRALPIVPVPAPVAQVRFPHRGAGDEATQVLLDLEIRELRTWLSTRRQELPAWRDAGFFNQAIGWYSAEELNELRAEITRLFAPFHLQNDEPATRSPGARPVRLKAWGIPATTQSTDENTEKRE